MDFKHITVQDARDRLTQPYPLLKKKMFFNCLGYWFFTSLFLEKSVVLVKTLITMTTNRTNSSLSRASRSVTTATLLLQHELVMFSHCTVTPTDAFYTAPHSRENSISHTIGTGLNLGTSSPTEFNWELSSSDPQCVSFPTPFLFFCASISSPINHR